MARGKWRWIAAGVLLVAGGTALATLAYPQLAVYAAPRKLARTSDGAEGVPVAALRGAARSDGIAYRGLPRQSR
jgi:hypothetical protein